MIVVISLKTSTHVSIDGSRPVPQERCHDRGVAARALNMVLHKL